MAILQIAKRNKEGQKDPTRSFSSKQEKTVAKDLNGKQTKNSGATQFQKGDILLENFLVECKTKTSDCDSISIKKEWLEKIVKESLFMGKDNAALVFDFGPNSERKYVIIDEDTFKQLLDNQK